MKFSKVVFLIAISIMISSISVSCARFDKRYIPLPSGGQGRNCVAQCGKQQQQCKGLCAKNYNSCTGQAKEKHEQEKKAYQADYQRQAEEVKAKQECKSHKNVFKRVLCETSATSQPTLDTSGCDKDCGCANDYDFCWTQCGGTIEMKCIANCS